MANRLADVARKVGVSEATVSRVLNEKPGVSEQTRQAVLTALDVLGYERPTKLRGERSRLVGLVLPELQNPIFPAFAEVVSRGPRAAGLHARPVHPDGRWRVRGGLCRPVAAAAGVGGGVRRRPLRAGRCTARSLPATRRARSAHRARQRRHRRPRFPTRVVRRPGRHRTGDGPPDLARPHTDRAAPGSARPRAVTAQARASAVDRGGCRPGAGAGPHRPLAVLAGGGAGRGDPAARPGHHRHRVRQRPDGARGDPRRATGRTTACPTTCRSSASTTPR